MKSIYEPLFTPWKIGECEIKNRIVMTSMGGTSIFGWMEKNHFDNEAARFLLKRAENNVGLILPGIAPIRDILFGSWIYNGQKKYDSLKKFTEEFHKTGAKIFIQLTAGFGRSLAINKLMIDALHSKPLRTLIKPILDVDYLTASASATPNRWDDSCISRPLTKAEINAMVEAFAKISLLLKNAGVDGVEVHAVHEGYLLDQFTMKYTNLRTDEYGGSLENRYRFATDIVKAIKKRCGADFPVSLRYSVVSKTKGFGKGALPGEEYTEVGRDMEESKEAVVLLENAGYDMLNCDNGTYDAWYWAHPPVYMNENCNLEEVKQIKKHVKIPVVCAGRMNLAVGSEAVKNGEIDAVGIARQFLTDPEWVTKTINDKEDDIRPCICCHNGCFNMAHYKGVGNDQTLQDNAGMARCALNPETMQSTKYKIIKTNNPKNIAVIGAGIGGMEVARVATLRGHKVTIYEKTNKNGGVFNAAASPEFKEKDKELLKWYDKQMKDLKIDIVYNHEVKDISSVKADKVVVATGSVPIRPSSVKGIDKAYDAVSYLLGECTTGERVAVIGGGLTGCEVAYDLFLKGKTPIIIEMKNDLIAQRGVCLANSSYLRDFFELHKVEVHLEITLKEIKDGSITVVTNGKENSIDVDSVILAIGYKPSPVSKDAILAGDARAIGNLKTTIWNAWDVAMKI